MAHDEQWLTPRLQTAATLCNQTPAATESPLWLGVDLGTCDVVSMVVDRDGQPVAVCLDWADVVRDGIVWDFFGAVTIVRRHLDTLEQQFGLRFSHAATSFPPDTDPRISINVLESAGLEVSHVLDEPTAVADLLQLDNAGVVDIGGGTTGIAIVKKGMYPEQAIHSNTSKKGSHVVNHRVLIPQPLPCRPKTHQSQVPMHSKLQDCSLHSYCRCVLYCRHCIFLRCWLRNALRKRQYSSVKLRRNQCGTRNPPCGI